MMVSGEKEKTMTMKDFIRSNREELDQCIKTACPNLRSLNDSDRREWVMNDEGLYNWARSEGVRV